MTEHHVSDLRAFITRISHRAISDDRKIGCLEAHEALDAIIVALALAGVLPDPDAGSEPEGGG